MSVVRQIESGAVNRSQASVCNAARHPRVPVDQSMPWISNRIGRGDDGRR